MLVCIVLFTGIFCVGCGFRRDEILLDEQEGSSAVDEADALEDFPEVSEVPEVTQEQIGRAHV